MTPRPRCVHCGAVYGQRSPRSETVHYPINGELPPYRGNGIVIRTGTPYPGHTGQFVYSNKRGDMGGHWEGGEPVMVCTRYIWDGESYHGGAPPFCTMRCAHDFASKAYARGVRL